MKYIDFFAWPQFGAEADQFYKARLLVGIVQIYTLASAIFALAFILIPDIGMTERLAGIIPTSVISVAFVAILYLIRLKGYYNLSLKFSDRHYHYWHLRWRIHHGWPNQYAV